MHVRRVGNSYMTNFFAGGNLFFSLLEHKRPLSLVCKIQTMSGSPASSWPPVLENVSARNKLMASFHGAPLIHSVLDVTGSVPLFADRLVVTRSREVHDYCQSLGIPVLIHTLPNRNEALCLGLTHMLKRHPDLSGCLFALGDQPLLRPRTLERICRRYLECRISPCHSESVFPDSDFSILKSKLPQNSGIAEKSPIIQLCSVQMTASPEPSVSTTVGSPILFDRAYFDELLHLPEKAGGSHVLRQHPDVVQYVTAEVPEELMDVDTPEELKRLENLVTIE